MMLFFFFFSSRRRHTRSLCDWSSDVCSSDLWPSGTYALWRPIKDRRDDARFLNTIAAIGAPNILAMELDVGHVEPTTHSPSPLTRTGLLVVNPPHVLIDEARALLPWLATLLAREGHGASMCSWL